MAGRTRLPAPLHRLLRRRLRQRARGGWITGILRSGSSAGGRNGATLLTTSSVFNDSAVDILTGAAGQDWFLANTAGAGVRDNMTDAAGEMITDLL